MQKKPEISFRKEICLFLNFLFWTRRTDFSCRLTAYFSTMNFYLKSTVKLNQWHLGVVKYLHSTYFLKNNFWNFFWLKLKNLPCSSIDIHIYPHVIRIVFMTWECSLELLIKITIRISIENYFPVLRAFFSFTVTYSYRKNIWSFKSFKIMIGIDHYIKDFCILLKLEFKFQVNIWIGTLKSWKILILFSTEKNLSF